MKDSNICASSPCENRAKCHQIDMNNYECECSSSYYTGTNCEISKNLDSIFKFITKIQIIKISRSCRVTK